MSEVVAKMRNTGLVLIIGTITLSQRNDVASNGALAKLYSHSKHNIGCMHELNDAR